MKRYLLLAVVFWPALALGEETYTNADLLKLDVPGAYTNEDLKRLPPLPMQAEPAARTPVVELPRVPTGQFQAVYEGLARARAALAAEREYEIGSVEASESASAGDARSFEPRLGYRSKAAPFIRELTKRIALLDRQIDDLLDAARRAGAVIDHR
jgi:hypothetical protein